MKKLIFGIVCLISFIASGNLQAQSQVQDNAQVHRGHGLSDRHERHRRGLRLFHLHRHHKGKKCNEGSRAHHDGKRWGKGDMH